MAVPMAPREKPPWLSSPFQVYLLGPERIDLEVSWTRRPLLECHALDRALALRIGLFVLVGAWLDQSWLLVSS